jgi:hypothetical protein
MKSGSRERGFRTFALIAAVSGTWALLVTLTGGFAVDSSLIHFSSRSPRNASLVAALSTSIAWALAAPSRRRQWLTTTRRRAIDAAAGVLRVVR